MNVLSEVSGPPLSGKVSERWIFDRIANWSSREPDRFAFAVDHEDRTEEYGYANVLASAEQLAAALHARGIGRGDRIGILMENIPQWVFALLGAMRLGAITVPLSTLLTENAIRTVTSHAGCRLIFTDSSNLEKACDAASALGAPVVGYNLSDPRVISWDTFTAAPGAAPHFPEGVGDDTAIIIYTSGTTGDPKGVQITWNNLIYEIQGVLEPLKINGADRILSVLPFSHILPLVANGVGPLCVGASVVFLSHVSPQRITEAFKKHRITTFICVPQFFYLLHKKIFGEIHRQPLPARMAFRLAFFLAARLRDRDRRRKLFARIHHTVGEELRLFASGGSRMDPRVAAELGVLGYTMTEAYGLTETTAAATATSVESRVNGVVGKPLRGVSLRIDSPNAEGIGEIWIRGPIVMKGYYREPGKTSEVLSDGWFHSGDLGYIRPDGNLVITGRSKDVIVLANGKNVYPEEIETHYEKSPYLKEICVLGMPEEDGGPAGERLHAVVVPDMDEFRRRAQTAVAEMVHFEMDSLSKHLPSYQRVLSLSIRNEPLPRTTTRKLKRFEIAAEETRRRDADHKPEAAEDHPSFNEGVGAIVRELVRETKPHAGALNPSTSIELDLGFDSLARVELFGLAESRVGATMSEDAASRIFTLGDLIEALSASSDPSAARGRSWKEMLDPSYDATVNGELVFKRWPITNVAFTALNKFQRLLTIVLFRLKCTGLEKLPKTRPYLLCPNHESFLDGTLLVAVLPPSVTDHIFILGYADYFQGRVAGAIAKFCNIVSIDPNVNLVRAMQVGAAGLRKKRVLVVFPEGTRSIDGNLIEFKKGAAILSFELGAPIVPVGFRGSFEAWPRGGRPRLSPIEIVFGDPIDPSVFANCADPYAALTDHLKSAIRVLADQA